MTSDNPESPGKARPVTGKVSTDNDRNFGGAAPAFRPAARSDYRQRHNEVEHGLQSLCSWPFQLESDFVGDFVRRNRSRPTAPPIGQTVPGKWFIA